MLVIRNVNIKLANGEKKKYDTNNLSNITSFELFFTTLGRCFEIEISFSNLAIASVEIITNTPVYIYVNMPGQITNEDSKSKVEVKMKQRLFIDVRDEKSITFLIQYKYYWKC